MNVINDDFFSQKKGSVGWYDDDEMRNVRFLNKFIQGQEKFRNTPVCDEIIHAQVKGYVLFIAGSS